MNQTNILVQVVVVEDGEERVEGFIDGSSGVERHLIGQTGFFLHTSYHLFFSLMHSKAIHFSV